MEVRQIQLKRINQMINTQSQLVHPDTKKKLPPTREFAETIVENLIIYGSITKPKKHTCQKMSYY